MLVLPFPEVQGTKKEKFNLGFTFVTKLAKIIYFSAQRRTVNNNKLNDAEVGQSRNCYKRISVR